MPKLDQRLFASVFGVVSSDNRKPKTRDHGNSWPIVTTIGLLAAAYTRFFAQLKALAASVLGGR